ncbi:hypothetical protein K437DRAFT_259500 [Tilletiaria anomala UBC 951]|uniref:Uncharacterized protein n=1 Tax=Tilletiaria anomala (strain ATCC 24038 / CBS 436.72 / UBC 951) TaxID=1037660 RepID=A0A066VD34_TILAU|nr:uncharacterized protein K437DRAFT_259500 [Tilletiaria anomala UBC 951]KDN38213.1 hypothetical protein K437DRAFT_259500 [Tilletiaria anomala UBC 951]
MPLLSNLSEPARLNPDVPTACGPQSLEVSEELLSFADRLSNEYRGPVLQLNLLCVKERNDAMKSHLNYGQASPTGLANAAVTPSWSATFSRHRRLRNLAGPKIYLTSCGGTRSACMHYLRSSILQTWPRIQNIGSTIAPTECRACVSWR